MSIESGIPEASASTGPTSVIRVLPDDLVDQIAAGEVVERPSSVVKELVENALDAGSTHVTIEVEQGGRQLIRVLDNGSGMSPEDARAALRRHATSKLRSIDDLFSLRTMGFRGEALPSIAAVSRMSLITRGRDFLAGTRIDIEGGEITSISEVGTPVGTQIEVRDLLFNVPARLKFLKGNATEASHISDVVSKLAMAHPHIHMRLRHNGRTAIDVPRHQSRLDRVKALLGSRLGRKVHRAAGEEAGITVDAYLTAPDQAQTTTRGLELYVGLRPIRDRGLLHAVQMGYGELLPKGRYPVCVIFIDVPDGAVDVNVHPQKLEVRFSDVQAVCAAVRHIVRRGVAEAPWLLDRAEAGESPVRMHAIAATTPPRPGASAPASELAARHAAATTGMLFPKGMAGGDRAWFDSQPRPDNSSGAGGPGGPGGPARAGSPGLRETRFPLAPDSPPADAPPDIGDLDAEAPHAAESFDSPDMPRAFGAHAGHYPTVEEDSPPEARASRASEPSLPRWNAEHAATAAPAGQAAHASEPDHTAHADAENQSAPGPNPTAGGDSAADFFSRLRYIGQLDRTYLLCETDGELVLVDQHAAHERVAFQHLRERYREHRVPTQRMLFPLIIELDGAQAAAIDEFAADLAVMGFELEPFGGSSYAVKTVPSGLRSSDITAVLGELLGELAERGGSRAVDERLDLALATIACHSVVRAGDVLSTQEVMSLFRSMDGVDFKAHCPHGRPVLLRISIGEIARRFGRS